MRNLLTRYLVICQKIVLYFYPNTLTRKVNIKAILILAFVIFISILTSLLISINVERVYNLKNYKPRIPSKLFDRKGRLITKYFKKNRKLVYLKDIPKSLIQAFIAMEDNHFYEHNGIDIQAIFRAFLHNLVYKSRQGGSTITQQLAKIILTDRSRTYIRKIKEAVLSFYIEFLYSKEEILNLYFNQIYLGHGNYGIGAASQFYFNKEVTYLSLGECAILASLPSAPNRYSPAKAPRLSMLKTAQVLTKMVDMNFIKKEKAIEAFHSLYNYYITPKIAPTETAFGRRIDKAPYYSEYIRQKLIKELGKKLLYEGGIKIYSSLDLDHQKIAQKVLWNRLEKKSQNSNRSKFSKHLLFSEKYKETYTLLSELFDLPEFRIQRSFDQYRFQLYFQKNISSNLELLNLSLGGNFFLHNFLEKIQNKNLFLNKAQKVQGALVEIDNKTGEITAMVGGPPFNYKNQLNRAVNMKRQLGSTFKPILYAAAIESKKVTASTLFPDSPIIFLDPEGGSWIPKNYSRTYRGFITLRDALRLSVNTVSIALAREIGLSNLLPTIARQMYVKEKSIPYNLSVALGTLETSPLQLVRTFSLFPRGGKSITTRDLVKILDSSGNILREYKYKKSENQIISKGTATIISNLLQDVINNGTGRVIRKYGFQGIAGGKTGTTDNFRDAWFVGYNKRYTIGIWVGYDRPSLSLGQRQSGGVIAAPIWAEYNKQVSKYISKEEKVIDSGDVKKISICRDTGKITDNTCSDTIEELYLIDTEPEENCLVESCQKYNNILSKEIIDMDKKLKDTEVDISKENFFEGDDNF